VVSINIIIIIINIIHTWLVNWSLFCFARFASFCRVSVNSHWSSFTFSAALCFSTTINQRVIDNSSSSRATAASTAAL